MTTLFSPIGTADPMTRLGDGPMLHLYRHYKPNRVVLFLSPKMQGFQDLDSRYTRAINDCAKLMNVKAPNLTIVKSEIAEVFRFDYYIPEFEEALSTIIQNTSGDDIIVNVSSGTPGMQEALVAIGAFGQYCVKLRQVTTPRSDANEQGDRECQDDYDYERLWSSNPDNTDGAPCRIVEVNTPNFSERLLRKSVIELVKHYDYEGASQIASSLALVSDEACEMITAASERLNLNGELPNKVFGPGNMGSKALHYQKDRPLFEYIQMLEVRLRQGHYADFIRALTPAITETMLDILQPFLPRESYMSQSGLRKNQYRFDARKVQSNPKLETFLQSKCGVETTSSRFKAGKTFLTNRVLMKMVERYWPRNSQDDQGRFKALKKLDAFESRVRNIMAHQIRQMDRAFIEQTGKADLDDVFSMLCSLNGIAPGLYDQINERIFAIL